MQYQTSSILPIEFKNKLWDLLDKKHKNMNTVSSDDEIGLTYQIYYIGMDFRKQEFKKYEQGEIHGIILEPKFNIKQNEKLKEFREKEKILNEKLELNLWIHARFENRELDYKKYTR